MRRTLTNIALVASVTLFAFLTTLRVIAAPLHATAPAPVQKTNAEASPPASVSDEAEEAGAADSPRASVEAYLRLCNEGRYQDAAHYLSVTTAQSKRSGELARRLKIVLDSRFEIDLDALSPNSEGSKNASLPPGQEQIGQIAGPKGKPGLLRLIRRGYPGPEARWVFSRLTVNQIDDWYDQLEQRWFLEHLPPYLLKVGPRDLLYWQWIALPILFLLGFIAGYVLSRATRRVLASIAARTAAAWDDALLTRLGGPLTLAWMLALVYLLLPWLGLYLQAEDFVKGLIRGGYLFIFFWVLSRLIEVWGKLVLTSGWAKEHSASRSLIPLGVRVGKIAVLVIAIIALVSAFGYPAASLLAGLGVGGLALALAAQKTVENLFGAFSIGADQPFREGDFIKVDDITGTVESLGLRSTRIRTLDRTLVSIPNGKLSEMRVESYTARDRLRLFCTLGLIYGTTAEQMRQVLRDLEVVLSNHPRIWPENIVVRFKEFGSSALNIDVMAWFLTSDWNEFQAIRQEVLLKFMECVQKAGSDFAFPTQTVHLEYGLNSKPC